MLDTKYTKGLESFLAIWHYLMLSFQCPPKLAHLYTAFPMRSGGEVHHKLLLSPRLELLRVVRMKVVEGILAVELAKRHDGVVHVLAAHHNQVAEKSAGVDQSNTELQVHLVQAQVCGRDVVTHESVSRRSWTFFQRRVAPYRRVAPPRRPHFDFRLRARIAVCALGKVMEFMEDEIAGLQVAFHIGHHVWGFVSMMPSSAAPAGSAWQRKHESSLC